MIPAVLFLWLMLNGVLGLRFGQHWDEGLFVHQVWKAQQEHTLLPHEYIYPSFSFDVVLVATKIYQTLGGSNDFQVCLRFIFLTITSLTVIWVYLLTLKITKNLLAATVGGLVVCASFELSYHSRWAVADGPAAQFAILSTAVLFCDASRGKKLIFSALIAGVAAGTKYTAGIVCLNILIFIFRSTFGLGANWKTVTRELLMLFVGFSVGFLLTTPGAVLEWVSFIVDIGFQRKVYASGHYGHTVSAGLEHFWKISQYVGLVLFAKIPFVSLLVLLLAVTGTVSAWVRKEWDQFGLFIVMLAYVIYVSAFRAMIVRNLLYILPYFAVLAGIGFAAISRKLPSGKVSVLFPSVIVLLLLFSCAQVMAASLTIFHKRDLNLAGELERYVKQNPDKQFAFSPGAAALIHAPPNKPAPAANVYAVYLKSEKPAPDSVSNRYHHFEKVIGIEDVNLDYYADWSGDDRIIVEKSVVP